MYILRGVTCHTMVILFLLVAPGVVTGVQGTYLYVVWSPPERPNGKITSYTLTFIRTQSSTARTVTTRSGDSFYVIQPSDLPWTSGSFAVTVSSTLCRFFLLSYSITLFVFRSEQEMLLVSDHPQLFIDSILIRHICSYCV